MPPPEADARVTAVLTALDGAATVERPDPSGGRFETVSIEYPEAGSAVGARTPVVGPFVIQEVTMTTATDTAPAKVAPGVVRMHPDQKWWWNSYLTWRQGPKTPDGFWMVQRLFSDKWAVRIVRDPDAPSRTAEAFTRALEDACDADEHAAQDDYLTALTIAAEMPPAELLRLRDTVLAGKAGGPADGKRAARRPTR